MKRIFITLAAISTLSIVANQQAPSGTAAVINAKADEATQTDNIDQNLFNSADDEEGIEDTELCSSSIIENFTQAIQEMVACIVNYVHSIMGDSEMEPIYEEEVRSLLCHRNSEVDPQGEINPRKERILSGVAKIISGVLNIARDPHNAYNVGDSVGNMVHGIINVTIDAVQGRGDKKAFQAQLDEITKEIKAQVAIMKDMDISK